MGIDDSLHEGAGDGGIHRIAAPHQRFRALLHRLGLRCYDHSTHRCSSPWSGGGAIGLHYPPGTNVLVSAWVCPVRAAVCAFSMISTTWRACSPVARGGRSSRMASTRSMMSA